MIEQREAELMEDIVQDVQGRKAKVCVETSGGRRRVSLQLSGPPLLLPADRALVHSAPRRIQHPDPRCSSRRRYTVHPLTPTPAQLLGPQNAHQSKDPHGFDVGGWKEGVGESRSGPQDHQRRASRFSVGERRCSIVAFSPGEFGSVSQNHPRRASRYMCDVGARRSSSVVWTPRKIQSVSQEQHRRSSGFDVGGRKGSFVWTPGEIRSVTQNHQRRRSGFDVGGRKGSFVWTPGVLESVPQEKPRCVSGLSVERRGSSIVRTPGKLQSGDTRRASVVLTPNNRCHMSNRRCSSIILPNEQTPQYRRRVSALTPLEQFIRLDRRKSNAGISTGEFQSMLKRRSDVLTPIEQFTRRKSSVGFPRNRRQSDVFTPMKHLNRDRRVNSRVEGSPFEHQGRISSAVVTPAEHDGEFRRRLSLACTPIEHLRSVDGRRHSILTPTDRFRRANTLDKKYHPSPEFAPCEEKSTLLDGDGNSRVSGHGNILQKGRKSSVSFLKNRAEQTTASDSMIKRRNTIANHQTIEEFGETDKQSRESVQNHVLKSCGQPNQMLLHDQNTQLETVNQTVQTPSTNRLSFPSLDNSVFTFHTLSRAPEKNRNSNTQALGSSTFISPPTTINSRVNADNQNDVSTKKRDSVFSLHGSSADNSNTNSITADVLATKCQRRKSVAFSVRKSLTPSDLSRRPSFLMSRQPRYSLSSFLADYHAKLSQQDSVLPLFSIHQHNPQISLGRVLGAGGFGSVYQGIYQNKRVAVKRMHSITKNQRARVASYKAELNAMRLQHPNIVQVLTSGCTQNLHGDAYIVMEYAGDRNLARVLDDPMEKIDLSRRIRFSKDIAVALRFIHANCIIHLDLKPANVIITPTDRCKLGDFGCCQVIEECTGRVTPTRRSELTGTFAYQAPEVLRGEAPSTKADIYSLGVTLWQLTTRTQPYSRQNQHVVIFGVVAHHLRPALPGTVEGPREEAFTALTVRCWQPHPHDRPPAHVVVETLRGWLAGRGRKRSGGGGEGGGRRCSTRG